MKHRPSSWLAGRLLAAAAAFSQVGCLYLAETENQAQGMPEPEVSQRQYSARRFRTVDVQDLFEDRRRLPVRPATQLAAGLSVYRRPRMEDEGVPENAEVV